MRLRLRIIKEDEAEVRAVEDKPCIRLERPGCRELDRYAVLEVEVSDNSHPYWQRWQEVEVIEGD